MGARQRFVIHLAEVTVPDEPLVGGEAARLAALTLLQARPITAPDTNANDKKAYYLTLRPGKGRLRLLQH